LIVMPFVPKRPLSLKHLTDEQAARSLSRNFGNVAAAARELGVGRADLRKLTWHNPKILDAAADRQELFVERMWSEAVRGLNHRSARVRMRAADRLFAHPRAIDHPFAGGLSVFAPASRSRAPNPSAAAERARLRLEQEASAERERERAAEQSLERQRELAFEQERAEVRVERRRSAATPASTTSLWPPGIRRPTRGRR
jgi:hypothetical protein